MIFFLLIACSQPKVLNFLGVPLSSYISTFYCITQLLYCIVLIYDELICFLRAIKFLLIGLIDTAVAVVVVVILMTVLKITQRPHRARTTYEDEACCYRPSSVVCWSVDLSVGLLH